jgi:hypothetical protein
MKINKLMEVSMIEQSFLQKEVVATARKLRASDKTILPIEKWGNGETLYVSQNEKNLYTTEVVEIDEEKFFVGTIHKK